MWADIANAGYRLVRKGGSLVATKARVDGEWRYWNPRPPDHADAGDCTTRAISFCTGMEYGDVRRAQDEMSVVMTNTASNWNVDKVWTRILTESGWSILMLGKNARRGTLAKMVGGCTCVTHSNGHVAAVFDGGVYDSWPSASEVVDWIVVPSAEKKRVMKNLAKYIPIALNRARAARA